MNINKLKNHFRQKNVPNLITFFRILLIIPIIIFLEKQIKTVVWLLIIIGGISDYLDGYISKKYNLKTKLGAIIDPLADKIFILIPFTWLCLTDLIPFWSLSLIFVREFFISSFRTFKEDGMPAIKIAKYKSFFQFITLILLFCPFQNEYITNLGIMSYWISFVLCIYSFINYLILI